MIDDGKQRETKQKRGLGKQVARDQKEWIPVNVPAVIDREIFNLTQERKEYNKRILSGHKIHDYLMKGRLTCSKCGYSARGQKMRGGNQYYHCNGKRQVIAVCDMPSLRGDWVDEIVWGWVATIIETPEYLRVGLDNVQDELQQANQALFDRMLIINEQILEHQKQLDKLLDLYLNDEFPKEILAERKSRLEQLLEKLHIEHNDLTGHIRKVTITDDQLSYIEAFCAKIRNGLEQAELKTKRQIIELLDVRGKIAFENNERVLYLKCLIQPNELQQRFPLLILHSSNTGAIGITPCASLSMVLSQ